MYPESLLIFLLHFEKKCYWLGYQDPEIYLL